jgi:hypothetical protein
MKMIITTSTECTLFDSVYSSLRFNVINFKVSTDSGLTWIQNPSNFDVSRNLIINKGSQNEDAGGVLTFIFECVDTTNCILLIDDVSKIYVMTIIEKDVQILYDLTSK